MARLEQLTRSSERPSLGARLAGLFRELRVFSQGMVSRHVWISSIILVAFMLCWLTLLRETPKVSEAPGISATQLLEYAQAAEVRALRSIAQPAVYQQLRIRTADYDVTRTIYRDVKGGRRVDRLAANKNNNNNNNNNNNEKEPPRDEGSASQRSNHSNSRLVERNLQQTFRDARLNWKDPLSPASYHSWRDSLSQKQDEVTKEDESITLKTITAEGPVAVASITIRTADFHPVAGNFRLRDMRHVEVDELDWQVISLEAVDPSIFVVEPSVPPVIARPITPVPAGPTDTELAESELQARVALHAVGADFGEEIEFDRDITTFANYGRRLLILRGILASPERKAELSAALRGIPNLELQLQTVEEAIALENQAARQEFQGIGTPQLADSNPAFAPNAEESAGQDSSDPPKLMAEDAMADRWSLDEKLRERFPHIEQRTAFVNRVIDLAQNALAQAWALRRLRDRYTPEEMARLSEGSRRTLELLIHDDFLALRVLPRSSVGGSIVTRSRGKI